MKNFLTLAIGLMIASSPAFATKARLEALGERNDGSYFIKDARNMFYNPAFINDFKKKLIAEFGTASQASDTTAAPKAEGGITNSFGDFAYGLYLGRESERTAASVATVNTTAGTSFLAPDNALDFFFGGDAGIKWGVNLLYAGREAKVTGTTQSASQLVARLGVEASNFQVFTTVGIMSKAKGAGAGANPSTTKPADELNGKLTIDLGATYTMENWTVFGVYKMNGLEYKVNGTKTIEQDNMSAELGLGYQKDVTKNVNLFSRIELGYETQKQKTTASGAEATTKNWNIPLTLGAEAQALSWLAIRGSVSQSILGQQLASNGNRNSILDSTQVAAGVGLTFGDVVIDGLVAAAGGAANNTLVGNGSTVTSGGTSGRGNAGFGDNMISRIGLTYNF